MATIAFLFATVLALHGFQTVQSDAVLDSRAYNSQNVLLSNSYDGVSNVIVGANPNGYQNERIVLTNQGYGSDNIGLNYNLNSGLNLVQTDSYGNNVLNNGLLTERLVNGRTLVLNGQPLLSGSAVLVNGQRAVLYGDSILLDGRPITLNGQTVVVNGQTIPNAIISNGQIITSVPSTVSLVNGYENSRLNPTPVVYIADPCLTTFEPTTSLTSCCGATAGLIPGLVGTRCCIAQGSKCSIHPNGCCAGTVCTSIGNPAAGIRICDVPNSSSYSLVNNNGYGTSVFSSSSYSAAGAKK